MGLVEAISAPSLILLVKRINQTSPWRGGKLIRTIKGGMKTNSFSVSLAGKEFSFLFLDFTHTPNTNTLSMGCETFSKILFSRFESVEKSLKCPGNSLKSLQIHCTSIKFDFTSVYNPFSDILPLFNSQFPPENPRRKTFHVHFKDFPCNIWCGCWMWQEDLRNLSRRRFPGATHFQLPHQMFWFW